MYRTSHLATKLATLSGTTACFIAPPALQACSNLSRMPKLYAAAFSLDIVQLWELQKKL